MNKTLKYGENLSDLNNENGAYNDHIRLLRPDYRSQSWTSWKLVLFSLKRAPKFAALSYSWGQRAADTTIHIDTEHYECSVDIAADLSRALHRLQTSNKLRWLWVDALCINQASNEEKANQVAMMRYIYRTADLVFVWLGERFLDRETHDTSMNGLNSSNILTGAGISPDKLLDWVDQGTEAWWHRLWVIQEVVACSDVVVCIGNRTTPWDQFYQMMMDLIDAFRELGDVASPFSLIC